MNKKIKEMVFFMSLFITQSCSSNKMISIGQTTFSYSHEILDSWGSEKVQEGSIGSFDLIGDGSTALFDFILGTYAIKAKIRNQGEEMDGCFIVDTGAQGNIVSTTFLKKFAAPFEEKFRFHSEYTYSPQLHGTVNGVIIPEFETGGFRMKDVLFEPAEVEDFGYLDDGTLVYGFIGMRILSEYPFLFSAKDKKLTFFDENFNPKGKEYPIESKYQYVIEIPVTLDNKNYMAKIDTGGNTNLFPYRLYKKMSKQIDGKMELRMSSFRRYMGLAKSVKIFDAEYKNIPIVSQKKYLIFGADDYLMIGEILLRNFDIYLDYHNKKIYFNPIEYTFPKKSMLLVYTSGGGNRYGYFGLNIARDKFSKKLRIVSLYYIDNKKICPDINIGDEVLSINGINQEGFNLDDFKELENIELTLQHKKKVYSVKLDKRHFKNCLEF